MDSKLHDAACDCSTCWFQRTMGVGTPAPKEEATRVVVQGTPAEPTDADIEQMADRRRTDPATGKPVAEEREVTIRYNVLPPYNADVWRATRVHKLRPRDEVAKDCCVLGRIAREHAEAARDEAAATQHEADMRMAQILNAAAQATGIAFTPVGDEKPDSTGDPLKGKDIVVSRGREGGYDVRYATDEERRQAEYFGDDCPSIRLVTKADLTEGVTLPPLTAEDVARIPSAEGMVVGHKYKLEVVDPALIAHTSNPEFEKLRNCSAMEALRDRTVRVDMPMPLLTADGKHKPPPDEFVKGHHHAQLRLVKPEPRTIEMRLLPKGGTLTEVFAKMNEMLRKAKGDGLPKPTLVVYDSISTPEGKTVTVSRKPTQEEIEAYEKYRIVGEFSREQWATWVDNTFMAPGGPGRGELHSFVGNTALNYAAIRASGEPLANNPYHLGKEAWDRINAAAGTGESLEGKVDLSLIAFLKEFNRILGPAMTDEERRKAETAKFVGFHYASPEGRKAIAEQHARIMDYVRQAEANEKKYGDATELTGDMNINRIATYGADSDPRAFGPFSPAQMRSLEAFRDAVMGADWKDDLARLDDLSQYAAEENKAQAVPDMEGHNEHLARHIQARMAAVQALNAQYYIDPFLPAFGKTREECLKELEDCVPDAVVEAVNPMEK